MTAPDWDQQMRSRLARGEESALGELYDQLSPLVHGLAGRILGDEQAAAQLTREVFGHLWEHPEEFDPGERSLRSWVGELTHRRAVERLRREDHEPEEIDQRAATAQAQYVVAALPPRCARPWRPPGTTAGPTRRPPGSWASASRRPVSGSASACNCSPMNLSSARDGGRTG